MLWIVFNRDGHPIAMTAHATRSRAILKWINDSAKPWKWWYKCGWRAFRCLVQPVKAMLLSCLLLLLCPGCVRYRHVAANGDRTTFTGFAISGEASKVESDTTYTGTNLVRTVRLGSVKGQGQAELLSALLEAAIRASKP